MFGPRTAAERLAAQRRAALVLADVLRDAVLKDFPCLLWTVGDTDVLSGQCLQIDPWERRSAFLAWAGFLRIEDWASREHDGIVTLSGFTSVRGVRVSLTANLFPADTSPMLPGHLVATGRTRAGGRS